MSDMRLDELERRLADASTELDAWTMSVDCTNDIVRRLRRDRPLQASRRRRISFAIAAALITTLGTTALVPSARAAVARWLGLAAIEIRQEPFPVELTLPPSTVAAPAGSGPNVSEAAPTASGTGATSTTAPDPGASVFGRPVTIAEADAATGLRVPVVRALGDPSAVFLDAHAPADGIIAVYASTEELPESTIAGVGLVVQVVRGDIDRTLYAKYGASGDVIDTTVNGEPALFVSGDAHPIAYLGSDGLPVFETARLAGPTLLWDSGTTTLRLESGLTLADAVALAESIR